MQERIYLLTGVAGFLGNNIAKQLINDGRKVRGLVLKGDKAEKYIEVNSGFRKLYIQMDYS